MSENYVSSDGYRPMILPESGELLLEGRQYILTPLTRLILKEVYGLVNVPTIVECLHKKAAPSRTEIKYTNLETGHVKESVHEHPGQAACFRAFLGFGRIVKFELDLAKLEELAPLYDPSHQLPGQKKSYLDAEIEKMERDWFATRTLPAITRKFRGCTLRWWGKEAPTNQIHVPRTRARKPVDLSLLD